MQHFQKEKLDKSLKVKGQGSDSEVKVADVEVKDIECLLYRQFDEAGDSPLLGIHLHCNTIQCNTVKYNAIQ